MIKGKEISTINCTDDKTGVTKKCKNSWNMYIVKKKIANVTSITLKVHLMLW